MTPDDDNWYSDEAATLGDRLAAAREAAGLTQRALAGQLGVKADTLDAWENDRKEPRANRLQMLTGLLGVSLGWLLTGIGEGPEVSDGNDISADVSSILAEMRSLRTQVLQASVRLGQLEKKLRKTLEAE